MSDFLWSLKNGDLEQVKEHVENKGVDVNLVIDGRPPVHYAADYGQKEVVQYLVEKGADLNVSKPSVSNSSISVGVDEMLSSENHAAFVTLSLKSVDKHGITALLAAIWEGHTDCVRLMLEKGASKNGFTPDGTSYLDAAEKDEIKVLLK